MDPLSLHDLEVSRKTPPAEKLAQALQVMKAGITLKRAALRHAHADATDDEVDVLLDEWLLGDE